MTQILVVDDTKNIRILLTKCLEHEGCRVTAVENGPDALAALERQPFDLVFLDVRMPEMSGTEVLRRMREKGVETPVIMITAFGTVKNAVECTQLGAVAYLQKPFTENKVHQVMQTVLEQMRPEELDLTELLNTAGRRMEEGRLHEAETLLKDALPHFFMEPEIYRLLAELYRRQGRDPQARKCLSMADSIQKDT